MDLQERLKQYFDNDLNNQNIVKAVDYSRSSTSKEKNIHPKGVYEMKKAAESIEYNYPIFYLLQDSTISNVLTVKKGSNDQESILCGIAKDNKTEKEFVWIIDLKNDLSTLLK